MKQRPDILTQAPAFLLIASAALGGTVLLAQIPALAEHSAGWRSFVGAALAVGGECIVGITLLPRARAQILAVAMYVLQLVAFSVGSVAYRLIAGPYLALSTGPDGLRIGAGIDARYLLIVGESNRVPPGIAINLIALFGLALLLTRRNESGQCS